MQWSCKQNTKIKDEHYFAKCSTVRYIASKPNTELLCNAHFALLTPPLPQKKQTKQNKKKTIRILYAVKDEIN